MKFWQLIPLSHFDSSELMNWCFPGQPSQRCKSVNYPRLPVAPTDTVVSCGRPSVRKKVVALRALRGSLRPSPFPSPPQNLMGGVSLWNPKSEDVSCISTEGLQNLIGTLLYFYRGTSKFDWGPLKFNMLRVPYYYWATKNVYSTKSLGLTLFCTPQCFEVCYDMDQLGSLVKCMDY